MTMAEKDIISKDIIKRLIQEISTYLFDLNLEHIEVLETQFQRVEERRADIVVKASEANRQYLLHIEIQNDNNTHMPQRMLRYRTDIALQWPGAEIEQYLIYIGKNKLTMPDGIYAKGLSYHYHIIDMHQIDCQYFLTQNNPDALVLAILCDFKGQDAQAIIHHIISELKHYYKENETGFRESISMLEILSSNRDLEARVKQEEKMMLSMRWDELPSYEIGLEEGIEKGIEKKKLEMAQLMKNNGESIEKISLYTGLSAIEIEKLEC